MSVYELSNSNSPRTVQICKPKVVDCDVEEEQSYEVRTFVTCVVADKVRVGLVVEVSTEFGDYHVNMLHPSGLVATYFWPPEEDKCWVPTQNILCRVECGYNISTGTFNLSEEDVQNVKKLTRCLK